MDSGWGLRLRSQRYDPASSPRAALLLPYAVCCVIALALLPLQSSVEWREVAPALALQWGVGIALALAPRLKLERSRYAGSIGIVLFLISVVLLRDGGGPTAGYGPLALLPVVWASVRGRRDELAVALAGLALVYIAPALVIGPPVYGAGSVRAGLLFVVISATVGLTVIGLVRRVHTLLAEQTNLAQTDELTGLPNRRSWEALLDRQVTQATRTSEPLSIAVLDLDFFKGYNDAHGHLAGDRLLLLAAAAWHGALRDADVLVRWGGDEFALLLPNCDSVQALEVVERLRLAAPDVFFSAGVAGWRAGMTAHELVKAADGALYDAKQGERNSSAVAPAAAS
ncbi:MAG TPA: GGDEF domain-containing protein [Solirubrobacteraceae bacterium]|jgi:diguanylate cyclase (GGDEF)-like protein